jgi:hypothetical protein
LALIPDHIKNLNFNIVNELVDYLIVLSTLSYHMLCGVWSVVLIEWSELHKLSTCVACNHCGCSDGLWNCKFYQMFSHRLYIYNVYSILKSQDLEFFWSYNRYHDSQSISNLHSLFVVLMSSCWAFINELWIFKVWWRVRIIDGDRRFLDVIYFTDLFKRPIWLIKNISQNYLYNVLLPFMDL